MHMRMHMHVQDPWPRLKPLAFRPCWLRMTAKLGSPINAQKTPSTSEAVGVMASATADSKDMTT